MFVSGKFLALARKSKSPSMSAVAQLSGRQMGGGSVSQAKLHRTLFSWRVDELFKMLPAKQLDANKFN